MKSDHPVIEERILEQWQEVTNLVAMLCHVPVSLIMRQNAQTMEVISGSQHPDSPYKPQETAPLKGELYCEEVIKSQRLLHVPNALKDPAWDHNPDIELGMIFYCGVPINWPDGSPFGTLCILDRVEKHATDEEQHLLTKFAHIVEMTLELMMANRKLEHLSLQDGLTGIANRRLFDSMLEKEWAHSQRDRQPLSLLLCDIDFFKNYNDIEGHLQGDHCLKMVAQALASAARRLVDLCARYGGEEFVLLLPNTDAAEARRLAELCRQAVYQLQIPHGASSVCDVVTISIGVSTLTNSGKLPPTVLIDHADKALYLAKQSGRNRVEQFYGDEQAWSKAYANG